MGTLDHSQNYYFSTPFKKLGQDDIFLIHPCYWLALNLIEKTLEMSDAEDIYDEYDIEVTSITEDQRNAKIEELLSRIRNINEGVKGAYDFEQWCFDSVKILFAGSLVNIELHPNKNKLQQRDIVATNQSEVPVWKRIYNDHKTRQVIFEVKNINELNRDNFRQINSYLSGTYGSVAFIICRGINNNLTRKEINWIKELHYEHKKIIVKISTHFIEKHLRKQRNPQKHDAVNKELGNLLDTYQRKHLPINS
ncbi:MAG: hypothetical protein D3903_08805 [Candidatus Electrothrix sp. GM3_4]|nr:hypothetical protein [Candidatus Electrothrix sp. GM3_4]